MVDLLCTILFTVIAVSISILTGMIVSSYKKQHKLATHFGLSK